MRRVCCASLSCGIKKKPASRVLSIHLVFILAKKKKNGDNLKIQHIRIEVLHVCVFDGIYYERQSRPLYPPL